METEARLLHRLLGLTVLRVSTGRETDGDGRFELDAVESSRVAALRAELLTKSVAPEHVTETRDTGRVLAAWQPSWLRYSPLSFSGLAMIGAAVGLIFQAGFGEALRRALFTESRLDAAERLGPLVVATAVVAFVLVASVALSVGRSLLTYGNLVLKQDNENLHLRHGLTRVREHTYDMRRLRGGTIRQPLLVRAFGGARLDAMMTGVGGTGEASLLLPPCPESTVTRVLTDLVGDSDVVTGPLQRHGAAATRRRWTRALMLPALAAVAVAVLQVTVGLPSWVWLPWAALTVGCALLAADRVRALGHRVGGGWLVARSGSAQRRRDCLAVAGIVGWNVRQSFFQRRAGVATLVAATASGRKYYLVIDVDQDLAWPIASDCSPWVADRQWATSREVVA